MPMLKDKVVLQSLAQFIWCTQESLQNTVSLRMKASSRGTIVLNNERAQRTLENGYYTFAVPKNSNPTEFRTISAPAQGLKDIQKSLLVSLRQIPISWAAQWWEPGTNPVKNAKHHMRQSYLYTTDVKSAYPSVSPQRMFKNLEGWLGKYLWFTFPYLSDEQKNIFLHILVTLISHHDALPQWAPTSSRMLNITMAKTDSDIYWSIKWGNMVKGARYTRYIDDIAISFRQFGDVATYIEELNKIITSSQKLRGYLPDTDETKHFVESQMKSILTQLESYVDVPNEHIRKKIRKMNMSLKEVLTDAMDHPYTVSNPSYKQQMFSLVHQINLRMRSLGQQDVSQQEELFRNNIQKIMNANGWTLKLSKDKFRWPGSSTAKEITGVMIGPDGRIGIAQEKMKRYVNLAKTAFEFPSQLDSNFLDAKWQVNPVKLSHTLNGIRNFIVQVKWRSPEYFEKRYQWCRRKYFPQISSHPKKYTFAGASNSGL